MTAVLSSSAPVASADASAGDATRTPALPVSFRALRRTFGTGSEAHTVLRDVDFDVRAGEVLAILGTSGCGKSTLLRAAAGLDAPSAGTVEIDGVPVQGMDCPLRLRLPGAAPAAVAHAAGQHRHRPAHRRQRQGRQGQGRPAAGARGPQDFAKHRPREISGGMAQRASLARALARNPGVLLLDEPFGALDALTRIKMQDLLLDVHRAEPTTVLLVTHDVDEALQLADRIIVLGKDPVPESGDPTAAPAPGATIVRTVVVPGERPRDRGSAELARMRASLLATPRRRRPLAAPSRLPLPPCRTRAARAARAHPPNVLSSSASARTVLKGTSMPFRQPPPVEPPVVRSSAPPPSPPPWPSPAASPAKAPAGCRRLGRRRRRQATR